MADRMIKSWSIFSDDCVAISGICRIQVDLHQPPKTEISKVNSSTVRVCMFSGVRCCLISAYLFSYVLVFDSNADNSHEKTVNDNTNTIDFHHAELHVAAVAAAAEGIIWSSIAAILDRCGRRRRCHLANYEIVVMSASEVSHWARMSKTIIVTVCVSHQWTFCGTVC